MPAAFAVSYRPSARPAPAQPAAPTDGLAALDGLGAVITLRRDEPLFRTGDAAEFYFKVLKGAVRGYRVLADGRRHIGEFFLVGDFIGLDASEHYAFAAEAITETTVIRYSRRKVDALVAEEPRVGQSLVEIMRAGLAVARERMLVLAHMTAMERIATFLVNLSGRRGDGRVSLPMTRTDIGDYLGLTMETVSRAMSQLKGDGIITQHGMHELAIVKPAELVALTKP
ncbi:MAG TPA: helix-turn-helix domain-containing protein [Stellaceae bacterium]|jgi:CRP/FNR family nitrogen fixation transcriptional regulator|nr:helix-turn-helix domain-containing protein [Stellaceae bacterium]